MRIGKILLAVLVIASVAGAGYSHAEEGLPITPGLYKVESKTQSNHKPEPLERTTERCIRVTTITPEDVVTDKNCKISNLKTEGNSASFDVSCDKPDGTNIYTAHTEYSTTSTTLKYKYTMNTRLEGKDVVIESEATATRIGECEQEPPAAE